MLCTAPTAQNLLRTLHRPDVGRLWACTRCANVCTGPDGTQCCAVAGNLPTSLARSANGECGPNAALMHYHNPQQIGGQAQLFAG